MYPAQTSFIPLTVAIVKYIVEGGSVWGNYPYWYMGEIPFRYLTGPVVPTVILGLQALFAGSSLFDWSLVLVVVAWAVAALGWGFLAYQLSGEKKVGVVVGVLSLVLPWHIVSSLALSEVSVVLASSLGPWVMMAFARIKNGELRIKSLIPAILLFAFLLLVNTVASIPTILGLGILSFVLYKHPVEGLKRAGLVIFLGGLLTVWWYDPGYWLKILFAPSFGGRSVVGSLLYVGDMARTLLPVALAFILVVWKVKPKNNFEKFAFLWLGSFIGLTFVRFVSNIHFWLDFSSWFGEIEVGLAMVLGILVQSFAYKKRLTDANDLFDLDDSSRSGLRQPQKVVEVWDGVWSWLRQVFATFKTAPNGFRLVLIIIIIYLPIGWGLAFANRDFWMPRRNIENTVEWQVADRLKKIVKQNEIVFLSGTSAFWLNSFVNVGQVRGGADQVGLSSDLAKAVWEVRMGSNGQKSIDDLKKMGINYLVVHSNYSNEFYHDFENPEKFEGVDSLIKVYGENGDIIYRVNER